MRYLRLTSIFLATASFIAVLVWLIAQNLVPSGVFRAHWDPAKTNALIGPIVPESRVLPLRIADDGTPYRSLIEEPVNFNVRLPSSFDTAKVSVTLNDGPKVVEIGGLASRETWVNDLRPAENLIIDGLGWTTVRGNGLTLYERKADFKNIDEFLANVPVSGVAVYRADLSTLIKIPGYVPQKTLQTYKTAFRGATTIKTYLEKEKLDFAFNIQEVNRHIGADGFTATAYLNGERIAQARYADDGNDMADGKLSALRPLRLYTERPVSGIVRIDLSAGDDVIFRETVTTQRKFVFTNRFYAADNVGYLKNPAAFNVVTNGRRLYATTAHPEAFQILQVGSGKLAVDDLNKPFNIALADDVRRDGFATVISPYGDLRLETVGLFAFGKENFFNPDALPLTWETDPDKDGINYILTSYVPPLKKGEWRTASAEFDLAKLSIGNRIANFTISAPGIDIQQKELRIASIDVELRRKPLGVKDIWPALLKTWRLITGQEKELLNSLKN